MPIICCGSNEQNIQHIPLVVISSCNTQKTGITKVSTVQRHFCYLSVGSFYSLLYQNLCAAPTETIACIEYLFTHSGAFVTVSVPGFRGTCKNSQNPVEKNLEGVQRFKKI